ncbi:hypothetical protein BDN72DRAFT_856598 [Pluteus cervinus]|uniref:Uncharacterized protein n=1 Tax=Pluteus cervinus TaxID=181527 RepID=A0ACD3AXY9_9AGAR|nr:hypothetical protein BDN72DRAFT_856598 [Pluteus cervinus]
MDEGQSNSRSPRPSIMVFFLLVLAAVKVNAPKRHRKYSQHTTENLQSNSGPLPHLFPPSIQVKWHQNENDGANAPESLFRLSGEVGVPSEEMNDPKYDSDETGWIPHNPPPVSPNLHGIIGRNVFCALRVEGRCKDMAKGSFEKTLEDGEEDTWKEAFGTVLLRQWQLAWNPICPGTRKLLAEVGWWATNFVGVIRVQFGPFIPQLSKSACRFGIRSLWAHARSSLPYTLRSVATTSSWAEYETKWMK